MRWLRRFLLLGLLAAAGALVYRHLRASAGRAVPGGILIDNPGAYDVFTGLLLRSFFGPVAADVAAVARRGARVLEVGCGPGHLSMRMATAHGLDVVGLDLDPAMIDRARARAARMAPGGGPTFQVGDVAALPFADGSFDIVVSTLSMHHWDDPSAALGEIARVLKTDGTALIWDLGPSAPLHRHVPDPAEHLAKSPLRLVSVRPWRWPWRLTFTQRMELRRTDSAVV